MILDNQFLQRCTPATHISVLKLEYGHRSKLNEKSIDSVDIVGFLGA